MERGAFTRSPLFFEMHVVRREEALWLDLGLYHKRYIISFDSLDVSSGDKDAEAAFYFQLVFQFEIFIF